ncbi:hypothetical protein HEP87_38040 [Streptomyces sp. S1D4-11]|nr:hypothetical protein [Streptomyces sp. S1D4-11]QIY98708.1 hypothetical protein HEP87_38040 [Streptomyces sp. S1D4-11]
MALSEVHSDVRLPVSAAQFGVWVARRMEPESPLYQCAVYYDSGPFDTEVLRHAVTLAVAEADTLRAGFGDGEGACIEEGGDQPHRRALSCS